MQSFNNQYNFRVDNQIKVINLLKNGQQSINYLAERLGLSFTAVSKIVDQLISFNVLKRVNVKNKTKQRGRCPALVKINTAVGVTCAIDFSSSDIIVSLNSLREKIIVSKTIENRLFVDKETLDEVSSVIIDLLKAPEVEGRQLLSICISAPGIVDKETELLRAAFRLNALENYSIPNYFFNKFNVQTHLYNDVKIACVGEMVYGSLPKDAKNYLFAHVGTSAGAAMVFGGKLYYGKNGFSGEFTNYTDKVDASITRNRIEGLWSIEERIVKGDPSLNIEIHNNSVNNVKVMAEEYKKGNPVILEAIDELAKQNAIQFIAYNDFLDFEYIVIEGSIILFKEHYQKSLLKYLSQFDKSPFNAKILFSNLEGKASFAGAIYQATRNYFFDRLQEITIERSSTGNYDISEAFSDSI